MNRSYLESLPEKKIERRDETISLICVFNDRDLYQELLASVAEQSCPCEMIGIDNTTGRFSSAASALNEGVRLAKNDWLVFLHQDIELLDENVLLRLVGLMKKKPDALYGVAGVPHPNEVKRTISAIKEGYNGFAYSTLQEEKVEGFTLDECMFACHKGLFEKIEFDEMTCDNWHFYAVDLCLQARLLGIPSYIVRANVWHKSSGSFNSSFWVSEKRLERKYRGKYKVISSTCTRFPTGAARYRAFRAKRSCRKLLRIIKARALKVARK